MVPALSGVSGNLPIISSTTRVQACRCPSSRFSQLSEAEILGLSHEIVALTSNNGLNLLRTESGVK